MFQNPTMNNVGDVLRRNAKKYPTREGIADLENNVRLSWDEINRRCNRLANGLLSLNIKKGDRVAILLLNCYQWMEIIFAVQKIGAVLVAVNTRLSPDEVRAIVNDAGANVLIFGEEQTSIFDKAKTKCPALTKGITLGKGSSQVVSYENLLEAHSEEEPIADVGPDDMAMIAYTSGTTGLPKGAVMLHRTILETIQDIPYRFEVVLKSRVSVSGPLGLSTVIYSVLNMVYGAATIVLLKFDILNVFKAIEEEKIEILSQASIPILMMATHPDAEKYDLNSLKFLRYGGSPLNMTQLNQIKQIFRCALNQGYGSTETFSQICLQSDYDHDIGEDEEKIERFKSVGRPWKDNQVRLVDDDDQDVPLGEVGEIILKSPRMLTEYWNNPDETKKAFRNGWFHTSDLAYMDEEGYVFIVDRKSDMVKSGGFSVYPVEVEKILLDHPGVSEVAVVSAPDEKWGERLVAVVVPREGTAPSVDALIDFCRGKIAGYKIPKQIDFRSEPLPKTAMEKIMRKELRKIYWGDRKR
jgi:long-chain acyl-CoA synthetase